MLLRNIALLAGVTSLTACSSIPFGTPPAPKTGDIKVVELVPGSIGLQLFGRDCAGKAQIVFTDQEGRLHAIQTERKPFCASKDGDEVHYFERNGEYMLVLPLKESTS